MLQSMLQYNEKMLVIACCDAEGQYLSPSVIFKGIRGIMEFSDGLPSMVFMNEKPSYTGTDIFFRWLKNCSKKTPRKDIINFGRSRIAIEHRIALNLL